MKLSKYILPILVFLLLFFYAPFMILFYQSFLGYTGEITLANYIVLFKDSAYRKVILYSLGISLETILFTLLLSYPAAYYVARKATPREKNTLLLLFLIPFWIDVLLRAFAVKSLLSLLDIREGTLALMLGMIYEYIPFMFLPIYVSMTKIPENSIQAAKVMGASKLQVLKEIVIPLTIPGIIAGTLLVGLMSMTEYVIPALLGGTKGFMIGTLIYYLFLSGGMWGVGAALTVVIVLVLMIASYLVSRKFEGEIEW